MHAIERSSRYAQGPAADSTAGDRGNYRTIRWDFGTTPRPGASPARAVGRDRGNYRTILDYRDGYVATTDPVVAKAIATGVVWMSLCVGAAILLRAFREAV